MVQISSLVAGCVLAQAIYAAPLVDVALVARGGRHHCASASAGAKAVYFITNAAQNSVVALKVAADGTLSDGSITATGGAGLAGIDGSTNAPAAPDSLFSQGAVKVAGNVREDPRSRSSSVVMGD
jgi:hypothetical protein